MAASITVGMRSMFSRTWAAILLRTNGNSGFVGPFARMRNENRSLVLAPTGARGMPLERWRELDHRSDLDTDTAAQRRAAKQMRATIAEAAELDITRTPERVLQDLSERPSIPVSTSASLRVCFSG